MQAQENEDRFGSNFCKKLQVRRVMQQQWGKWGVTPGDIRDPSGAAPNGNEASGVLLKAMPIDPTPHSHRQQHKWGVTQGDIGRPSNVARISSGAGGVFLQRRAVGQNNPI